MRLAAVLVLVAACRPPGYGKELPVDADETGDGSGSGSADAAIDAPTGCDHAFRLDGHATSTSVWLTGDFIAWGGDPQHGAVEFTLGVDGAWTGTYHFALGSYQYKFIVDGSQWIVDPTNPNQIDDGFGGKNSVYDCQ